MDLEVQWLHYATSDNLNVDNELVNEPRDYAALSSLSILFKQGTEVDADIAAAGVAFLDAIKDDLAADATEPATNADKSTVVADVMNTLL